VSKTIKPVSFSSVSRPHRHVGAVLDDCFGGEHGRFLRRLTREIDSAFLVAHNDVFGDDIGFSFFRRLARVSCDNSLL